MSSTTWAHPRRVLIRIPSTGKFESDLMVGFEVSQAGASEFEKILNGYLQFCADKTALIKVKDEVTDIESGHPYSMTVEIHGVRQAAMNEMQRIGNSLMQHSRRIR
jgi:hypothetical protein